MDVPLLTASLLPVPHGFTTRAGGVSDAPFASLNLGLSVGDRPEAVAENFTLLARTAGIPVSAWWRVSQVHGDAVVQAPSEQGEGLPPPCATADALWTDTPGHAVGVLTADCVPLLLVDPDGRRVAAVHSGWRGTAARIAARAVEALVAQGARPERLLAATGPCIQRCCYQVSGELAGRFDAEFGPGLTTVVEGSQARLDLVEAVERTLRAAGLRAGNVQRLPDCTACDAGRFYSHRRDAGHTGRHLSFAVCDFA
ncbi:MAG: peptidoglycan editing factor PgeF [Myxococcaceae bacterium]|nr:peptidoglycan editing factor PgeF [Myxococcaceae bacterium]